MTEPYDAIACCVDRDEMAEAVLAEALRLADGDPTRVRLVHVVAPPRAMVAGPFAYVTPLWEAQEDARAWLEELAATAPGVRPVLLEGPPVRTVTEWVEEEGVDLIVAAASRSLLERALLGGFASNLAYHAPCSVLFVRPPAPDGAEGAEAGVATEEV